MMMISIVMCIISSIITIAITIAITIIIGLDEQTSKPVGPSDGSHGSHILASS